MDDINAVIIGQNIARMLSETGHTQRELADFCGVHPSTPSAWVLGKKAPRPTKLAKICEFFGCTLQELLQPKSEGKSYYVEEYAAELAQLLYEHPDYKVLFDAVRTVKKEDLEFVKDFIDRLRGRN